MAKLKGRLVVAAVTILLRVPFLSGTPTFSLRNIADRAPELEKFPASAITELDSAKPGPIAMYREVERSIYALESWEKNILEGASQSKEVSQSIGKGPLVRSVSDGPLLSRIDVEGLRKTFSHSLPVSPAGDGPVLSRVHDQSLTSEAIHNMIITQLEAVSGLSIYKRIAALQALQKGDVCEAKEHLARAVSFQTHIDSFHLQQPSRTSSLYKSGACVKWLKEWEQLKKKYKSLPTKTELNDELQKLASDRIQLEGIQRAVRSPGEPGENQYTAVQSGIRALEYEDSCAASLQSDDLVAALQSLRSAQSALAEIKQARDKWVTETGEHFSLMDYEDYRAAKQSYETKTPSWVPKLLAWLGVTATPKERN